METVGQIVSLIINLLPKETGKEFLDNAFDWVEDKIAASENKIDDAVIQPLINKAREILDVPDGDD